ncbi:MAG: hypothetical protein MJZ76_06130, partial [Bacteroidales bacterium]|nr:hypothetical protein [Bacteroidales bacterium]
FLWYSKEKWMKKSFLGKLENNHFSLFLHSFILFMNTKLKRLVIILSLALLPSFMSAQVDYYDFYEANEAWQGGLNIGINSFWGDVNDYTNKIFPTTPFQSSFYQQRGFVLGGSFGKRMTPFWTLNLEFKLANVYGKNYKASMQFASKLNNEIVLTTTFDILALCKVNTAWSVYPRIGMGVYGFKSRVWNTTSGKTINAYPIRMEEGETDQIMEPTHFQYVFAMPFGIGVGYRVLPELNLFLESSMTWVSSDMLDAYLSNDKRFEGVWTTSIGVTYQFDFPIIRRHTRNGSYNAYDPALKKDSTEDEYKRKKQKSVIFLTPAKSHSKSAVKTKKAKRKSFSM